MAKVIDSQFLIIEGKGEEFMQIGFGAASVQDQGVIKGGVFDGFGMVNIEGGSNLVYDFCNTGILPSETCYYIAVLNQVYCSSCYQRWKEKAVYYPEDARYEKMHYHHTRALFMESGVKLEELEA